VAGVGVPVLLSLQALAVALAVMLDTLLLPVPWLRRMAQRCPSMCPSSTSAEPLQGGGVGMSLAQLLAVHS
jgi:hypothetical protein